MLCDVKSESIILSDWKSKMDIFACIVSKLVVFFLNQ